MRETGIVPRAARPGSRAASAPALAALAHVNLSAELDEGLARPVVAGRHRGEDRRRLRGERGDEPALRRRRDRDVEQHDGQAPGRAAPASPHRRGGQFEQRGAVGQRRPSSAERRLEASQELADVLGGGAHRVEGLRPHPGQPDLAERRRQGAREPGNRATGAR